MKKITLSALLITLYTAYAIFQRTAASSSPSLVPINLSDSGQTNPSPTPTPALPIETPTPTDTPVPSPTSGSTPPTPTRTPTPTPKPTIKGLYADGSYTGVSADAYYGYIQVKAIISGGKLVDVVFLDYPKDRNTSVEINTQAMPYLKQEAIAAQSASVNIISGATDSSYAFKQSLSSALTQAKN